MESSTLKFILTSTSVNGDPPCVIDRRRVLVFDALEAPGVVQVSHQIRKWLKLLIFIEYFSPCLHQNEFV